MSAAPESDPGDDQAAETQAFAAEAERQAALFFDELLPRCLDAWFAGRGHHLVTRMLAVHDADAVLGLLDLPAPSERARRRAAGVRSYCPWQVLDHLAVDQGAVVLGLYTHQSRVAPHFFQSFQVLAEEHRVWLFSQSFMAMLPPERWPAEILLTLFHEYIHVFESHLPAQDQPLRARERGQPARTLTPEQARREDRRFTRRRVALWATPVLLAIGLGVAMKPPRIRDRVGEATERKAAPAAPTAPRDYAAERAALRSRVTQAVVEGRTREAVIAQVGHPVGDTTSTFSHGVLTWARLVPRPGHPPVPDTTGRAVMCWSDPGPILAADVLCVVWLDDGAVIFEAMLKKAKDYRSVGDQKSGPGW